MREIDLCSKCHLFEQYYDYWGDCYERCQKGYISYYTNRYHLFCYLPRFVKRIWKKLYEIKAKNYEQRNTI